MAEHSERGKSDENVNNPFHGRPAAENKINDVPVASEEAAYTDKSPVKGADKNEKTRYFVQTAHTFTHHGVMIK